MVMMMEIDLDDNAEFVFHQGMLGSQDVGQTNNHGFVQQQHALEFACLVQVWNGQKLVSELLLHCCRSFFVASKAEKTQESECHRGHALHNNTQCARTI